MTRSIADALRTLLPDRAVVCGEAVARYLSDATEARGLVGTADAVAVPASVEEVAAVVRWCYEHDVPVVPRGGGTGLAGGAVPHGGVVLSTERLRQRRSLEPLYWRAHLEAGLTTRTVQRLALENGLYFPPDPGAAEQSQLGGNLATNAGGPHAFARTGRDMTSPASSPARKAHSASSPPRTCGSFPVPSAGSHSSRSTAT